MEFGFRLVNIDKALACISFVLNHPSHWEWRVVTRAEGASQNKWATNIQITAKNISFETERDRAGQQTINITRLCCTASRHLPDRCLSYYSEAVLSPSWPHQPASGCQTPEQRSELSSENVVITTLTCIPSCDREVGIPRSWASWAQPSARTETPGPRVLTSRGNITGVSCLHREHVIMVTWGTLTCTALRPQPSPPCSGARGAASDCWPGREGPG